MSDAEELPPSKLGTKEHWDQVYEREVGVFEETGDEGEIWFGESSVQKMVQWSISNVPPTSKQHPRIIECGCGNGTLLLEYLKPWVRRKLRRQGRKDMYRPGNLCGVDYSEGSVKLARRVEDARRENGWAGPEDDDDEDDDDDDDDDEIEDGEATSTEKQPDADEGGDGEVSWDRVDLLRDDLSNLGSFDLVLDKGTFDALALSQDPVDTDHAQRLPSLIYPEKVAGLVKRGGYFLITSCNFTEQEVKSRFGKEELGLVYHSTVPQPTFRFGGQSGTSVCTVAFQKS